MRGPLWMRRFFPLGGWATADIRAAYPRAARMVRSLGYGSEPVYVGTVELCRHLGLMPPRPGESCFPFLDRCEQLLTRNAESG